MTQNNSLGQSSSSSSSGDRLKHTGVKRGNLTDPISWPERRNAVAWPLEPQLHLAATLRRTINVLRQYDITLATVSFSDINFATELQQVSYDEADDIVGSLIEVEIIATDRCTEGRPGNCKFVRMNLDSAMKAVTKLYLEEVDLTNTNGFPGHGVFVVDAEGGCVEMAAYTYDDSGSSNGYCSYHEFRADELD